MDRLLSMRVFARVVDAGGFARAGRELNLSPAAVTRLVADLEEHLGARLLTRTTRRVALTDTGEAYLQRVRQILAEVEEAEAQAGAATTEPRGHLRVLAPPAFAVHQLAKHLPAFHARFPQVTLELVTPGPVGTIDETFDVTLLQTATRPDGDFIARRLARSEVIACASPEYLDRRGRPAHPDDLAGHDAMLPTFLREVVFRRGVVMADTAAAQRHAFAPRRPVLGTSHLDTIYAAALHGLGIGGLPSYIVEDALREGALERVLPEWTLYDTTLYAALPTRRLLPARTRAFVDYLVEAFGGEDRDPWLVAAGCATR